jgi:4-hydroxybenzoate polyprenyltransferase
MTKVVAMIRACHPLPTAVVTSVVTLLGWGVGWRGASLAGLAATVLIGQLSVGWSNDAFDADLDRRALRLEKPAVEGAVSARGLWRGAIAALVLAVIGSVLVAGWVGGAFHVLALASAWAYNLKLSRTVWSWVPYAVSFASIPPFLTFGLSGSAPPLWQPVVFAVIGVSAHLANAVPDADADRQAGVGGLAVKLGAQQSTVAVWLLLSIGTTLLAYALFATDPALAGAAVLALMIAIGFWMLSRSPRGAFRALMAAVVAETVVLVAAMVS